jgi:hypothetical protein
MKTPSRKQLKEAIEGKGIASVLRVPRQSLTHKQRKFAEALVLDEMTGADAYRTAYDSKASPKIIGTKASMLKAQERIKREIEALEQAKQVAALHSAEALRSLVISSLTSALIDPEVKAATKIQAAKVLGTVTEVAAFTERKQITTINDSAQMRERILQELKSIALQSDDVMDVDASALLTELVGGGDANQEDDGPTAGVPHQSGEWDSGLGTHTNPHEPSSPESEPPPLSGETDTPGGDIFLGKDGAAPQ